MASFDVNWAGNPYNRAQQLAQASLPQILFGECRLNCVGDVSKEAESQADKLCMANCQKKANAAFDIMMKVRMR